MFKMINCPWCNSEIESGSWYCDQCGKEISCCVSCGKPGTREKCLLCGDNVIPIRMYTTNLSRTIQPSDMPLDRVSAVDKKIKIKRPVKLYFVNYPFGIRFEAVDGAIIGRKTGLYASILKDQLYISGKHAIIEHNPRDNSWTIKDLNSSNGTFLNGNKLPPDCPVVIHRGDKVQLANIELVIEFE